MPESALDLLHRIFGHREFRGEQAQIVEQVARGGDALVLMPTGGGKSLCYQIPALLRPGTGIVVSPLIALMQDQVDALRAAGVAAAYLNSSLDAQAQREVERQLLAGELNLLYVAPERLLTGRFLGLLEQTGVALFAIPYCLVAIYFSYDFFRIAWEFNEYSDSATGLPWRWIPKGIISIGLILLLAAVIAVGLRLIVYLWGPERLRQAEGAPAVWVRVAWAGAIISPAAGTAAGPSSWVLLSRKTAFQLMSRCSP